MTTPESLGTALPSISLNPAVDPPISLTRELNKKQSPFRQLVEGCAPALAVAGGRSPEGKRIAERLGLYELVRARVLAPLPEGVTDARRHSPTVGTAFDIRTRMMLGKFEPRRSASAAAWMRSTMVSRPAAERPAHIGCAWRRLPRSRGTHQGRRRHRPGLRQHHLRVVRVPLPRRRAGHTQLLGYLVLDLDNATKPSASASGCHDRQRSEPGR